MLVMIVHMIHILFNIVSMQVMIHCINAWLNSINIGYGQMVVQVNLSPRNHFFGCVTFKRKQTLDIYGISLKLDMERKSMIVSRHV